MENIPTLKSIYIDYFKTQMRHVFSSIDSANAFVHAAIRLMGFIPSSEVQQHAAKCLVCPDHMDRIFDMMYENMFTRQIWLKSLDAIIDHDNNTTTFHYACDAILKNIDGFLTDKELKFVRMTKDNLGKTIASLNPDDIMHIMKRYNARSAAHHGRI